LWTAGAGVLFGLLNALMRAMSLQLDPFQTQFLRYVFGALVMAPLVFRGGMQAFRPKHIGGQFLRGVVHTAGLCLWFLAIPKVPLAVMTSIGFTGPIFIMIGAAIFLHEAVRLDRCLAALAGFVGVAIVVGPNLSADGGMYTLVMLAASPMFAASFLITKKQTRYESAKVIVLWQTLTVTVLSLPLALLHWQAPTLLQLCAFAVSGVIGTAGNYCLTRAFAVADISASQSVKFLDLVWASLLGWLIFADQPSGWTLLGGAVICTAAILIARREARVSDEGGR
jgi:drug/metabolite transporter (DMT)-like permease